MHLQCNALYLRLFVSFTQTYLVTGGVQSSNLASTELLHQDASQWVYAGALPSARQGVIGATLGDKLIMTGDGDDDLQLSNI